MSDPLRPVLFFLIVAFHALPAAAEEEWKYRFFTRILNVQTGKPLKEPITAEIKIVSKIDDHSFKAVIRDNDKAFNLDAKLFSKADQEYLRKWNPTFAIDLRDFPIEKVLEQAGYEVVNLTESKRAFFVPVTLNGENLTFLVDTGAWGTLLDKRIAEKLKMPMKPTRKIASGIGGRAGRVLEVNFSSLKVGGFEVKGRPNRMDVLDLKAQRMDGILGFELLSHLHGMIDYKGRRMFIRP